VERRGGIWCYEHGRSIRCIATTAPDDLLIDYVGHLCCGLLPSESRPTGVGYIILGGSAKTREQHAETGGVFELMDEEYGKLRAMLHGWGV
jgi:hypothetical protein